MLSASITFQSLNIILVADSEHGGISRDSSVSHAKAGSQLKVAMNNAAEPEDTKAEEGHAKQESATPMDQKNICKRAGFDPESQQCMVVLLLDNLDKLAKGPQNNSILTELLGMTEVCSNILQRHEVLIAVWFFFLFPRPCTFEYFL